MFEELGTYRVVLVTGPQRSGTRIAARMIAADSGLRYVDEDEFGVYNHKRLRAIIAQAEGVVIQCPAMCHMVHKVAAEDVLVVMMMRDVDDIVASEKRIDWTIGPYQELKRFQLNSKAARSP